jgi:peroxiredoxin
MIKVGDTLPSATLMEYVEVEGNGCSIGPNPVDVTKASAGKTIALFALPGAFHAHLFGQARARLCGASTTSLQGRWCR